MNEPYEMNEALYHIKRSLDALNMPIAEYADMVNTEHEKKGLKFRIDQEYAWQYRSGYVESSLIFALNNLEKLCKLYNFIEKETENED